MTVTRRQLPSLAVALLAATTSLAAFVTATERFVARHQEGHVRVERPRRPLPGQPEQARADEDHPFARLRALQVPAGPPSSTAARGEWFDAVIEAPHDELGLDAAGHIVHEGRVLAELVRGAGLLHPELRLLELVGRAAMLPADSWPQRAADGKFAPTSRPIRGPVVQAAELPVDLIDWLNKPEGRPRVASQGPVMALSFVASAAELPRTIRMSAAEHAVFLRCDGSSPMEQVADGDHAAEALLQSYFAQGILSDGGIEQ